MLFFAILGGPVLAAEPFNSDGDVGRTSYKTLPFQSQVFQDACGSTAGLYPVELYFQVNPNSIYKNAADMTAVKNCIAALEAKGIINVAGMQRWEDTWEISNPQSMFPNEPASITADRSTVCSAFLGLCVVP